MNKKNELLKAAYDLLKKCHESHEVLDVIDTVIFYDNAKCDGFCLANDIAHELGLEELK